MNIKSLLIGSAALATVSTGAQAADAIVMADPEPMEYVRICDVYGAGFFYIPGTETCLKIGGYMRYSILHNYGGFGGIHKQARFTPKFDVRSDTGIGTLRGYAEIDIDWDRGNRLGANAAGAPVFGPAYGTDVGVTHAYIQILRGSHGWLFGRTDRPWSRFLGYGMPGQIDGLHHQIGSGQEISYTFTGSNGFSFIAAIVDDEDGNFTPDAEIGFVFARGWGHIGLIGRGDFDGSGVTPGSGAKGSLLVNFGNSGVSWKTQVSFVTGGGAASGLGATTGFQFAFTPKFGMYLSGGVRPGALAQVTLGANIMPTGSAAEFLVRPEVSIGFGGALGAALRIERGF